MWGATDSLNVRENSPPGPVAMFCGSGMAVALDCSRGKIQRRSDLRETTIRQATMLLAPREGYVLHHVDLLQRRRPAMCLVNRLRLGTYGRGIS